MCSSSSLLVCLSPVLSAGDAVQSLSQSPPSLIWLSTSQPVKKMTAKLTFTWASTLTEMTATIMEVSPASNSTLSMAERSYVIYNFYINGEDVRSYKPSLIFLDSASEPFAALLPARGWAACSFLSAAHTWDGIRLLHTADRCLHSVRQQRNFNSAYQSLCKSSLLFVLSCLAVHGAPTKWSQTT